MPDAPRSETAAPLAARLETRPAQPYVYLECDAADGDVGKVAPPLIGKLAAWLGGKGAAPSGPPFFNYVLIGPQMQLHIQVAFPLAKALAGDAKVKAGLLPAGRYGVLRHTGPYQGLREANARLYAWGEQQGLRWEGQADEKGTRCKARFESYVTDPGAEKDPAKFVTDVVFLVAD